MIKGSRRDSGLVTLKQAHRMHYMRRNNGNNDIISRRCLCFSYHTGSDTVYRRSSAINLGVFEHLATGGTMIIIGIIMMAICGILVGYLIYLTLTADIFRWIYGRIFLKPRTIEK